MSDLPALVGLVTTLRAAYVRGPFRGRLVPSAGFMRLFVLSTWLFNGVTFAADGATGSWRCCPEHPAYSYFSIGVFIYSGDSDFRKLGPRSTQTRSTEQIKEQMPPSPFSIASIRRGRVGRQQDGSGVWLTPNLSPHIQHKKRRRKNVIKARCKLTSTSFPCLPTFHKDHSLLSPSSKA